MNKWEQFDNIPLFEGDGYAALFARMENEGEADEVNEMKRLVINWREETL